MNIWFKCALWWTVFFTACGVAFVVFHAPYGPRAGLVTAAVYPPLWIAIGVATKRGWL